MKDAEQWIKSEVARLKKTLGKCKSRWLNGYIDGLEAALKAIKAERKKE